MTEHPLSSDKLKKKLAKGYACTQKELDRLWKEVDKYDNMRAAADWQLEQVMKWLDENLSNYTDDDYLGDCEPLHKLEGDLKKAMRPTKTQENN